MRERNHDYDGNTLDILRDESPKITRAEEETRAELAWEPIYKQGTSLKGDDPQKLYLGPLTFLSLDSASLTLPCYNNALSIDEKGPIALALNVDQTVHRLDFCYL